MVCTRGVSVPLCQGALWFPQSLLPRSSWICIWWAGWRGVWCCCHDMCGYTCPLPGAPTSRNIDSWPALLPTLPFATFHPLFHLQPYGSQFPGYFILCICAFNSRIKVSCADNLCAEVRWFAGDSWRVWSALHCTVLVSAQYVLGCCHCATLHYGNTQSHTSKME